MFKSLLRGMAAIAAAVWLAAPAQAISFSVQPGDVWKVYFPYGATFYDAFCDMPGCHFQMIADVNKAPFEDDPGFTGLISPARTCGYRANLEYGEPENLGSGACGMIGDADGTGDFYATYMLLSGFTGSFQAYVFSDTTGTAQRVSAVALPAALPLLGGALGILAFAARSRTRQA